MLLDGREYYLSGLGSEFAGSAAIRCLVGFRRTGKASQLRLGSNMAVSALEIGSSLWNWTVLYAFLGLCGSFMWSTNENGTSLQRLCVNGENQWLGMNERMTVMNEMQQRWVAGGILILGAAGTWRALRYGCLGVQ